MNNETLSIIVAGDLVINQPYNAESQIDPNLIEIFRNAEIRIVNLEAPVTKTNQRITKTGPHLKCTEEDLLPVLKALDIDIVTLANNHIMDHGAEGLIDTFRFCEENNLQTVGAGESLSKASKILYVSTKVGTIAIINFAENEWASASDNSPGANPMDLIDNQRQIKEAKNNADYVFVIVHGGNEYNHYPSPRMVKEYRFYAESGADAVIGHHTHCIGGYETFNGVPIIYSLGNFLFTMQKALPEVWYKGLVLKLEIKKDRNIDFQILPVGQEKQDFSLKLLSGEEEKETFSKIQDINLVIQNPPVLTARWNDFIVSKEVTYIRAITPIAAVKNKYAKAILSRLKFDKVFMNQLFLKETLNRIRCEAHYEVTKEILKRYIK